MRSTWLALALGSLLPACGGTVVFEEDGVGDAGGGSGDGGATATSTSASTSGPTTAIATSTKGAGGGGDLVPTIVEVAIGANCKPEIGPDPLLGAVSVAYENLGATPGSLTLSRAEVVFSSGVEGWVFPLELVPTTSGEVGPGETVTVQHDKAPTDGDSAFVCQLCGMAGQVQLHFLRADGSELVERGDFDLGCAL